MQTLDDPMVTAPIRVASSDWYFLKDLQHIPAFSVIYASDDYFAHVRLKVCYLDFLHLEDVCGRGT